jgi:MFS family permease
MSQIGLDRPELADVRLERNLRAVVSVWLPCFVVVVATGLCLFGLSWWMSRDPHGGARLGVVVGVASASSLVWVMLLSGLLDRTDRYRSVVSLLLVLAIPTAVLLLVYGLRPVGGAVLLAGACYLAIHAAQALYLATTENMVADLAPPQWPSTRTAMLGQLPQQVGAMVAPAIAGLLIAGGALWNVAAIAMVTVRTRFTQLRTQAAQARASDVGTSGVLRTMAHDVRGSMRLIVHHHELVYIVVLGILSNLVMFPFYAVLPAYIAEYDLPERSQALLFGRAAAAYAFGLLASSLLLLRWRRRLGARRGLGLATAAFVGVCVLVTLVTLVQSGVLLIGALVVCGALFAVLMSVAGAVWLDLTPAPVRVRVFALRRLVAFSSIPVGTMLMGFGGAALGYHSFIRGLTVVVLILTGGWWLAFRQRIPEAHSSDAPSRGASERVCRE